MSDSVEDTKLSKRERQQERRQERLEEEARQRQAQRNKRLLFALGIGPGVIAAVLILAGVMQRGGQPAGGEPAGVETIAVASRQHQQQPVRYAQTPPVGGDHAPVWQNCGFYDKPVPNETSVHARWSTARYGSPTAQTWLPIRSPRCGRWPSSRRSC